MNSLRILAYTDGSCLNNPGPGGVGVYMRRTDRDKKNTKKISFGFKYSTNNEMELGAILLSLIHVSTPSIFTIYTDSQYAIDCLCKWHHGWAKANWTTCKKNKRMIQTILMIMRYHTVEFVKVRGHSGDPGNELADRLAKQGSHGKSKSDVGLLLQGADEFIKKHHSKFAPGILSLPF